MPHATNGNAQDDRSNEPLAIVGMACTLAGGVDSASSFWQTLVNKEIKQSARVPESRFNIDAYFHDDAFGRPAAIGSKGGYFLDTDLHAFDAEFFGYEADEAKHMDPQHFRILESVYECLESAGRTMEDMRGTNTAVYVGNFSLDQVIKSARHSYDDRHLHEVIGVDPGLLSSRVSYCYDMNGPVFTTNTGCTSSLFALHTAALALRGGECTSAIVGGVNLLQGPEAYSSYSKFGIMSPDSMCHSYDARCNGYCRAEGVGALYVRLLSDAIRDGDPIRGVIRSMAVNSNGAVPGMPLFVPNQSGLEKSLKLAYAQANLNPNDTAFVETHGIGMILGEIAEAHAVGKGMNEPERRSSPVLVGSLKPNFGHQEAASGIFVLMKAAMMTEAGVIPGHTGFQSPHPAIDLEKLNVKPQTETIPWPEAFPTRRVGLCSYGWSGTNAHGIVEAVQTLHPDYLLGQRREQAGYDHSTSRPFLLTLSAFKESSLSKNVAKHQAVADQYYAADLVYTLNQRRSRFAHRVFAVITEGAPSKALDVTAVTMGKALEGGERPKIGFSFGDVKRTSSASASDLLDVFPTFAHNLSKLDDLFKQQGKDLDLTKFLQSGPTHSSDELAILRNSAVQIALVDLLAEWDIRPNASLQQANGEIAAAYAAGRLSVEEAVSHLSSGTTTDLSGTSSQIPLVSAESLESLEFKLNTVIPLSSSTSILDLLRASGELYVQGYPVNLARLNAVPNVDWLPSFLPDLPPYQWDHAKSYSTETHANLEHRLNKHPYHDLLGRRVHGLSPQTMIWKNKLSFRDLPKSIPWIPNEKPLTVHGAAHFLSAIAEALEQGFEPRPTSEFVIRDFRVLETLRYAEDCDLIELQTSISRIPGAEQGVYRVGIESIREGVWTTHCEGTIVPADAAEAVRDSTSEGGFEFAVKDVVPATLGCRFLVHPSVIEVALRQIAGDVEVSQLALVRVLASVDDVVDGALVARRDAGKEGVTLTDKTGKPLVVLEGIVMSGDVGK